MQRNCKEEPAEPKAALQKWDPETRKKRPGSEGPPKDRAGSGGHPFGRSGAFLALQQELGVHRPTALQQRAMQGVAGVREARESE